MMLMASAWLSSEHGCWPMATSSSSSFRPALQALLRLRTCGQDTHTHTLIMCCCFFVIMGHRQRLRGLNTQCQTFLSVQIFFFSQEQHHPKNCIKKIIKELAGSPEISLFSLPLKLLLCWTLAGETNNWLGGVVTDRGKVSRKEGAEGWAFLTSGKS